MCSELRPKGIITRKQYIIYFAPISDDSFYRDVGAYFLGINAERLKRDLVCLQQHNFRYNPSTDNQSCFHIMISPLKRNVKL